MRLKPVVLIILDGFGHDKDATESPWKLANHPNFSEIEKFYPFTTLQASGIAVGLPWGEEGNSEVGHLTIGAGRIIYNHLPRIIMSIHDGSFFENKTFLGAIEHIKKNKSKLHIMGLFSSGSVHAYADHLYALLDFAKKHDTKTYLHLFTDGRDASLNEGVKFIRQLEERLEKNYPDIKIASIIGRHFAMNRDEKWDRIEKTYKLLTEKTGEEFELASLHIEKNYKQGITDEFVEPGFAKASANETSSSRIQNGDAIVFFNYREDSTRELTRAFIEPVFDKFPRKKIADLKFVTMTQYDSKLPTDVAFPPLNVKNPLARTISLAGLRQLHIAETEKYAHITYFLNGGQEQAFEKEERILVPSPKTPHYDTVPEMSAYQIVEKTQKQLDNHDFVVINFANADMVGHTGNFEACIKSIEILDDCIGKLIPEILKKEGAILITSDHGNVEEKIYKLTGEKMTKHTTNPVPFYLIGNNWKREKEYEPQEIIKSYQEIKGTLADIAPTILEIMEIKPPSEMTGKSLIAKLKP